MNAQGEIILYILKLKKLGKVKERFAVRAMLKERKKKGFYCNLVQEMKSDSESFINFHRMDVDIFNELLSILGPSLKTTPNRSTEEITTAERLSLTLRYLASGDSMKSIGFYGFRVGASTTSNIIRETCQLIWEKLNYVFPTPSVQLWEDVASEFYNKWNFPNCLGALPKYNTLTYNYKNSHSLILLGVSDANYKFVLVDIGALGHNSDGSVFRNSTFGKAIKTNSECLSLPPTKILPGTNVNAPLVFVGDEAFPLFPNLMRPFPGRHTGNLPEDQVAFNYRLSRARRVVENAFGILANRWRIYRKPIVASKETVINIIKATTCLHNWLRMKKATGYLTPGLVDEENADGTITSGSWRESDTDGIRQIGRISSNNTSRQAKQIRAEYKSYFSSFPISDRSY